MLTRKPRTKRNLYDEFGQRQRTGLPVYDRHRKLKGFGVGPLRTRRVLEKSYGRCRSCGTDWGDDEPLYGGLCKFCHWMTSDFETGEGNKRRRRL